MLSNRITIRISGSLAERLRNHAGKEFCSDAALVRRAIVSYLAVLEPSDSAYDLANAAGLIGCVKGKPPDLSVNRE